MLLQVVNFTGYRPIRRTLLDIVFLNSTPQKIANLRQTSGVEIRVVNCLKQRESYLLGGQCKTWTADWV